MVCHDSCEKWGFGLACVMVCCCWVFVWLLLGCGGRVCVYVTWLVLVEPMCIQTTIGSAKKLAALRENKFGEGALSFSNSKSDKKKNKTN